METAMETWAYIKANYYGIAYALAMLVLAAEFVVRLTPTKKDDGAVRRFAGYVEKLFDLLKIPNIKRKDGTIIVPDGKHPKK